MDIDNLIVKPETSNDFKIIYSIHNDAFSRNNESKLIDILRKTASFDNRLSLVAFIGQQAVGHILFYPLNIKTNSNLIPTLGLVPLAVKPEFQNQGIGTKLVIEGLKQAKSLGYNSIIVTGDPNYYRRFGFKLVDGIKNNIGEPLDHFMYLELKPDALKGIHGIVNYPPEFNEL